MAKFKCDKCGKEVKFNSNLSGKPHMVNCPGKGRWVEVVEAFVVAFYGLPTKRSIPVPVHISGKLSAAETAEEIEQIISDHEAELARLHNPVDDFLVCDTAAELMADVLRSKGIGFQIVCGINDEGDAHSYVRVGDRNYDPTHQGFGDGQTLEEKGDGDD